MNVHLKIVNISCALKKKMYDIKESYGDCGKIESKRWIIG